MLGNTAGDVDAGLILQPQTLLRGFKTGVSKGYRWYSYVYNHI